MQINNKTNQTLHVSGHVIPPGVSECAEFEALAQSHKMLRQYCEVLQEPQSSESDKAPEPEKAPEKPAKSKEK